MCEPHDHKSGGLEPLGPIGVYAYAAGEDPGRDLLHEFTGGQSYSLFVAPVLVLA